MTEQELTEVVKKAAASAIDEKLGQFYIDREQHYQDHEFVSDLRKWAEEAKSTFWTGIIKLILMVVGCLLLWGFVFWGRNNLGK